MKTTQADKAAFERMKPGAITAGGFLGADTRPLDAILEADLEDMRRLGLEIDTVVTRLERLKEEGSKGLGEPVTLADGTIVSSGDARGVLPCPWNDGVFHKNSVVASNPKTGAKIIYSDLSLHMLKAHGFCQGKGSEFRLEPAELKKLSE